MSTVRVTLIDGLGEGQALRTHVIPPHLRCQGGGGLFVGIWFACVLFSHVCVVLKLVNNPGGGMRASP